MLDDLICENYISLIPLNKDTSLTRKYHLSITERGKNHLTYTKLDKKFKSYLECIVTLLSDKSSKELDLLVSVHYILTWAKDTGRNVSTASIYNILVESDSDLGYTLQEVNNATTYLKRNCLV
ncbi:MAG: hypothetical protein HMLIMOIP_000784 [Candidatus Nitrosomirales archaeon]|jgi:hypothetical protein